MSGAAKRSVLVLVVLVVATVVSAFGSAEHLLSLRAISVLVLVVAAVKITLVMWEFMEIRHAPAILKTFCALWLTATTAALVILHLAPAI